MRSKITAVCIAGIVSCGFASASVAGEITFTPSIMVAEEYNDNIYETWNNRESDFITHLTPGITASYKAPLWDWDLTYSLNYAYYARLKEDETTHGISTRGLVRLIDEFLFLEVSDTYRKTSLDVTRDVTQEGVLGGDQTDQNIFTASPYMVFHPTDLTTLRTGYRYTNVWYKESTAVDKTENGAFADLTYQMTDKFSLTGGYVFTNQDTDLQDYNKHDVYGGFRYEYAESSFIHGRAGNSWIGYQGGRDVSNPFWNAGITHTLDTVTLSFDTGVIYTEDPRSVMTEETSYTGRAVKKFNRGEAGISLNYAEYRNTDLDTLETTRYGTGLNGRYDLTESLIGHLNFTAERYNDKLINTYTNRFVVDYGVTYAIAHDLSVGLNHRYIEYSSPGILSDNKRIHRVILSLNKTF